MKTVYLVPHTHYDVAWAFTKEDYLQIMETVLAKVLDLLQKKNYKFIIEQTYLLQKLEERNPELWVSLKKMIEKGRIEIVDGQYAMQCCHMVKS
jgi:alpha-mannosidase